MHVTEHGASVEELIDTVKRSIKAANLSSTDGGRDLRVGTVDLHLNVVATKTSGGGVDFRIPFIGMQVKLGGKVTRKDTHAVKVSLTPPAPTGRQVRDDDIESVFLDAVRTIRATMVRAAGGDDPFVLKESSVGITFAITQEGSITLGVDGSFADDVTHTLTITLVPAVAEGR
ncbi:trypco2 family protein [Dactylosporangium sp. NPDC005555]|uniref:trypco2 family protein n=1 Tax=Dactylosporangium sp. NPDC005555 TaxID=3154889 RepID=UPI0033B008A3